MIRKGYRACRICERANTGYAWRCRKRKDPKMTEQSDTPIGDAVESEVLAPGLVRGIAPHGTSEDGQQIQLTDPYTIPGEDDPDDPQAETATEADDQAEASDNSGEPEAGDEPQEADAVQDNANELDGDEPDATE